jgi:MFS family permease
MVQISSFSTQRYYRIAVSIFFFIQGLTFGTWSSRIPDIQKLLHINDAALGGVLFSLPLGQFVGMFYSGFLVSKFGSKKILIIAALIYPAVLLWLGSANSPWLLSLALFIFGLSGNLMNISVNTQGVGVERIYGRNILASFHGIWSLAGFTAGLFSNLMVGFSIVPFYHFCIIYGISLILLIVAQKSILPRDGIRKQEKNHPFFVKPNKLILILGTISFGSLLCEGTMFNWSSLYFEKVLFLPETLIRTGFIAFLLTMSAGRFLADWLASRFGIEKIIFVSGFLVALGLCISVIFPHLYTATFGFLLVGLGTSSIIPLCYSLAGKTKNMHPGMAVTTVSMIGFLGYMTGPTIVGVISEISNLRWAFGIIAVLCLLIPVFSGKIKSSF